ncbi:MAG: histidine kinase [Spirochaetes bacterium]|nr:histidine kinase [Spirochaetota bacterium]
MRLRGKILLGYVLIIVFLSISISAFSAWVGERNTMDEKIRTTRILSGRILANFESFAADIDANLFRLYANAGLPTVLAQGGNLPSKSLAVQSLLRTMCVQVSYLRSVIIIDKDLHRYIGGRDQSNETVEGMDRLAAEGFFDNPGPTSWLKGKGGEIYLEKEVFKVFPLQYLGRIAILIDDSYLGSAFGVEEGLPWSAAILSADRRIITSRGATDEEMTAAALEVIGLKNSVSGIPFAYRGKDYSLTSLSSEDDAWHILSLEPVASMLAIWKSVKRLVYLVTVLASFGAIAISILISNSLTGNVNKLIGRMEEVSAGKLNTAISIEGRDEICLLSDQFDRMTGKHGEAMERVRSEEAQKHQAEYKLLEIKYRSLQSQVSPHFICNILSTIDALTGLGEADKADKLAVDASAYLRRILQGHDRKYVSLAEELEGAQSYVGLFGSIYGRACGLAVKAEEESLGAVLPNMLLQPLVENSLIHGFNPESKRKFKIEILARIRDQRLLIEVRDNGSGFKEAALEKIRQTIGDPAGSPEKAGFGFYSVIQRLSLLYPGDHRITAGNGIRGSAWVEIDIPFGGGKADHDQV